jgi:hypothetical protein
MNVYLVVNKEDRVTRAYLNFESASRWVSESTSPGWCRILTFTLHGEPVLGDYDRLLSIAMEVTA